MKILIASLSVLLSSCALAQSIVISKELAENPDGTFDTEYPTGNKPPTSSALTWLEPQFNSYDGLLVGAGASQNVRNDALAGTAAATAAITVVYNSGSSLATGGISMNANGDMIDIDCTGAGAGSFILRAIDGLDIADSNARSWSCLSPPTGDTTAPTVPISLATTAGDTQVTLGWQAATDVYDGEACSGIASYDIRLNGSPLTTVTSGVLPGPCPQFAQTLVGGTDGSPSSTQTGVNWSITGAGAGFDSTSDQFNFVNAAWTGDFVTHVKVDSLTSSASFAKASLMARADETNVQERFAACMFQKNDKVIMSRRTVEGAADDVVLNIPQADPVTLRFSRVGDLFSCDYSTDDGVTWIAGASTTVSMPAAIRVGLAVTAGSSGVNATAEFSQFGLTNSPSLSYVHATGTGGSYSVAATDGDGNTSSFSGTVTGTPQAPGGGTGKKNRPGHYMKGGGDKCDDSIDNLFSGWSGNLANKVSLSSELLGLVIRLPWGAVETTSGNDDWTRLDALKAEAEADGKLLIIETEYKCNNGDLNIDTMMPDDLESEIEATRNGWIARMWDPAVADRFIAFSERLAARYDDDPTIEMIGITELCPSFAGNTPSDYTVEAFSAQLQRVHSARAAAFTETHVVANINCPLGSANENVNIAVSAYEDGVGLAGPDTTSGNAFVNVATGVTGGFDYNDTVPILTVVSAPNLGGRDDELPLSNIQSIIDDLGATHVAWYLSSPNAGGTPSEIVTHIEAGGGVTNQTNQDCPSQYTALGLGGCQ